MASRLRAITRFIPQAQLLVTETLAGPCRGLGGAREHGGSLAQLINSPKRAYFPYLALEIPLVLNRSVSYVSFILSCLSLKLFEFGVASHRAHM